MAPQSHAALLRLCRRGLGLCASRAPSRRAGALALALARLPHAPPPDLRAHCSSSYSSRVKVRSYFQYMKHKLVGPPVPPYKHVCQLGDPVLRLPAAAVDPAAVGGAEIQHVVKALVTAMRRLDCVGLSAPQIGVPLRILALEYPEKMLQESPAAAREARGLSAQPLRIFVNPRLRVLDARTVLFREACESVSGFSAAVPRYLSVEVSGTHVCRRERLRLAALRLQTSSFAGAGPLHLCCECSPRRSEREGRRCHLAGQRLARPDPPARGGPPGRGPLRRPHG